MSLHRGPAPAPTGPGQRWSMDFVHDQLVNGQPFRVLTVVDNWSRESPVLEVGFRLTGNSVVEALSRVGKTVCLPACITVDHGTEFTSRALDCWAWENKVQLDFTRPGKPTDNGLCESFNGRLRDECLNAHEFESLEQAQRIIEAWRRDYNDHRRPQANTLNSTRSDCQKRPDSSFESQQNWGDIRLYKAEVIHRRGPWKTRASVELATLEWVSWFNHHRLLSPIGYIPPAEAEENYYRQLTEKVTVEI